ncbi:hypothetical protein [Neobacillus sp. Marseille-QA0830]
MYRNKNVNIILILLSILVILVIAHVITHIKVYVVYSTGLGPIFVIGLIICLIVLFFFKG